MELDENQHRQYECEDKRMMEIFRDLGSKPLVLIRLNPDSYKNKSGNRIPSSFKMTKKVGFKKDEKEWGRRTALLKDKLDYFLNNKPEKEISIISLFYDEV